jgi:hypothetical protein
VKNFILLHGFKNTIGEFIRPTRCAETKMDPPTEADCFNIQKPKKVL